MAKKNKTESQIGYTLTVTKQLHFPTHRELIRYMRETAGLTQVQLARKIKTHQTAIARLESTKRLPTLSTLFKISKACGFEMSAPIFACKKCHKDIRECLCKKS